MLQIGVTTLQTNQNPGNTANINSFSVFINLESSYLPTYAIKIAFQMIYNRMQSNSEDPAPVCVQLILSRYMSTYILHYLHNQLNMETT